MTGIIGKVEDATEAYLYCMRDHYLDGFNVNINAGMIFLKTTLVLQICILHYGGRSPLGIFVRVLRMLWHAGDHSTNLCYNYEPRNSQSSDQSFTESANQSTSHSSNQPINQNRPISISRAQVQIAMSQFWNNGCDSLSLRTISRYSSRSV